MLPDVSAIEQIAQDIEHWGDGWRVLWNPDDGGRRARLARAHSPELTYEIEIHEDRGAYYVFTSARQLMSDGHREAVSFSAHNPINRKALAYVNDQLDSLEAKH